MRKDYSIVLLCRVLGVSKSGYFAYLKRPNQQVSNNDRELLKKIKRAYTLHKGTYGSKRMAQYLKAKGTLVNHKKVARIIKEANIKAVIRRPKTTKVSKDKSGGYVYENLLERGFFMPVIPNQKWVTDMTEIQAEQKKFYISAIVDLFNREVIAFEVSSSPNKDLLKDTIEAAQRRESWKTLEGVLIHSDQGNVYRSFDTSSVD